MPDPGEQQQVGEFERLSAETRLCPGDKTVFMSCQNGNVQQLPKDVAELATFALHPAGKYQLKEIEHRQVDGAAVLPVDNAGDPAAVGRHPKVSRTEVTVHSTHRQLPSHKCCAQSRR